MRVYAHGVPRVKEGQTMSVELLQLGNTPIQVQDDEFGNGFQVGYLHFKADFQGKPITDELLYTVIAQTFVDVRHTSRCNAGYLTGFILALLETPVVRHSPMLHLVGQPAHQSGEMPR
jgi:hypothetical protein